MSKIVKLGIVVAVTIAVAVVVTAAVGGAISTSNVAPEKVAGPGSMGNPALDSVLQGGDTCGAAVGLGALPATVSGTTIGYANDYEEVCPYSSTSPDVVYSYTPAANMTVIASLCTPGTNTDYDTKLFIYENACPGTLTGCNDDSCTSPLYSGPYVSELMVDLTAGNTYYFVVDGYGGGSGNYTLNVEEFIVQTCPCPPDADLSEGALDPDCGNDPTGGLDPTGGCNSDPNDPSYFVQIQCNTVICGTTSTYTTASGDSRDTDWFNLVLPGADTIRVTLTSEAPLYLFELGPTDCATAAVVQNFSQDNCAGTGEMVINGVAGNNWIWVGPQGYGAAFGVDCPTEYTLTVTCDTYPVELQSLTIE